MSVKLLWLPQPGRYRLRVFAGPNTQTRVFAGELTLLPADAAALHAVLEAGDRALGGTVLSEAGWVEPTPAPA